MAARKRKRSRSRRISLKCGALLLALVAAYAAAGVWFVHHPRAWIADFRERNPALAAFLCWIGNPVGDITDALAWTGHDAVYEYDLEAPSGSVLFAGEPRRTGAPAPADIVVIDRGEFKIGWSPSLRHPVWCAYHVAKDARFGVGKRPAFNRDRTAAAAPAPGDYALSGYDRGHMVPNYAIASRYGEAEQKKTFLTSNISPQSPALNRGVWRDMEHRIAELWTARYGEIWVVVGAISSASGGETMSGTGIDVPEKYYQIVVAQSGMDVRALAVVFEQGVDWKEWPARHIATIDEIEEMSGLDFLPDLPEFLQSPLEAELPSRLWPIRLADVFRLLAIRFN